MYHEVPRDADPCGLCGPAHFARDWCEAWQLVVACAAIDATPVLPPHPDVSQWHRREEIPRDRTQMHAQKRREQRYHAVREGDDACNASRSPPWQPQHVAPSWPLCTPVATESPATPIVIGRRGLPGQGRGGKVATKAAVSVCERVVIAAARTAYFIILPSLWACGKGQNAGTRPLERHSTPPRRTTQATTATYERGARMRMIEE